MPNLIHLPAKPVKKNPPARSRQTDARQNQDRSPRYPLPDSLRGLCFLSMAAYHLVWDLVFLFSVDIPWFSSVFGVLWQQSICWSFILLSGFCWPMGSRPLRRGAAVLLGGVLVSAASFFVLPQQPIYFGILTFLGCAMLLAIPLRRILHKIPPLLGVLFCFTLFLFCYDVPGGRLGFGGWTFLRLPAGLYQNLLTAFFGFPPKAMASADYFPLFPWFFLFLCGCFLHPLITGGRLKSLLWRGKTRTLSWVGRNCLLLYLLHQPILYLFCFLFFSLQR